MPPATTLLRIYLRIYAYDCIIRSCRLFTIAADFIVIEEIVTFAADVAMLPITDNTAHINNVAAR